MKMARKDVGFAHPAVVKEPVGRLGVGPIAAGPWEAAGIGFRELPQNNPESLRQPFIGEAGGVRLPLDPV